MIDGLRTNSFLRRELDVRASRDEGYRLFNYAGPGLFLLLLLTPLIFGLMGSTVGWVNEIFTAPLFLVTVWLQALYFSHSAARFCAGSIAVERERGTMDALRLIPRPAHDLFVAKYAGSIAPLLVEALVSIPFMATYAWTGNVALHTVFATALLNIVLILFFGMWGMFWSVHSRDVLSAVSRGFCTVLACNVLPVLLVIVTRLSEDGAYTPLFFLSPLCVATALVHPANPSQISSLLTLSVPAVLVYALLYRGSLKRLSGR